tara:strand:+ start:558 stop:890 length:333 start_codon:yes stop_codon:yes gene_type:complete
MVLKINIKNEIVDEFDHEKPKDSSKISNIEDNDSQPYSLERVRNEQLKLNAVVVSIDIVTKRWFRFNQLYDPVLVVRLDESHHISDIEKMEASDDSDHFDDVEAILPVSL